MTANNNYMLPSEIAKEVDLTPRRIQQLAKQGEFGEIEIHRTRWGGTEYRIPRDRAQAWIREKKNA